VEVEQLCSIAARLLIHVKAVVAKYEEDCELWGKHRRHTPKDLRRRYLAEAETKLNRAREILVALETA
jgi:hypothetical protein